MPCLRCLCCLFSCPDACAHQYLNKLNSDDFEYFRALDQRCFSWHSGKLLILNEIADKHDIVGKVVDGFEKPVLVVRKVDVDHQGFVTIIFYCIITLNFEIYFLGKERFVWGDYVKIIFLGIIQVPYVLVQCLGNSKT